MVSNVLVIDIRYLFWYLLLVRAISLAIVGVKPEPNKLITICNTEKKPIKPNASLPKIENKKGIIIMPIIAAYPCDI